MHVTILRMISNNSLAAFSAATTVASAKAPRQSRLVPAQTSSPNTLGQSAKSTLPATRPSVSPPRGTLLNLSV